MSKRDLLDSLERVDSDPQSRDRVLQLEIQLRQRIKGHIESLPLNDARFEKFHTSPFVLLMHSLHRGYSTISQIESDILPAKLFSSMETSAGRLVEDVTLPAYGWECVTSEMHSANSALDGRCQAGNVLKLATLKSGPRCLNDEMSENFADAIIGNATDWAHQGGVKEIEFTYGVLYGTKRQSNKKDWHILRNIYEKVPRSQIIRDPNDRWDCAFEKDGVRVDVTVRVGLDWWTYLGGPNCLVELCSALIRACIPPSESRPGHEYTIMDLAEIVSTAAIAPNYNVSLLQRSQFEWLFFTARHFCDSLAD